MIWLDDKFVNAANLHDIKLVRNQPDIVYNLKCVVCGDHPSGRKRKAYIYEQGEHMWYHCHLCGYSAPFFAFLKRYDETLFGEYILEKMMTEGRTPKSFRKEKETISIPFKSLEEQLEARSGRMQLDALFQRCDRLPTKHVAIEYLRDERKIPEECWKELWYADDSEELMQICPTKTFEGGPRILFPAFHPDGTLIAVTGRAIYTSDFTRYLEAKYPGVEYPVVFGWDKVDFNKQIYVTEGPIDRLFLPNSLAAGGSDLKRISKIMPKDRAILVFDNQPFTKEIVKLMETAIAEGFAICIWPKRMVEKDINDLVLAGKNPKQIIDAHVHRGLTATVALADWRKC